MASRLTITQDHVEKVIGGLHAILGKEVLIGIPESSGAREDGPVNNATLGYVHEFGSPAHNIPARPFLIPGVEKATPGAIGDLKVATELALAGDKAGAERAMYRAGARAMNAAKAEISSNVPPPLKPATIRNRNRSRGTLSKRPEEEHYGQLIDSGMPAEGAQAATGIISLINTGSLRNALTYVLGNKAK